MDIYSTFRAAQDRELWTAIVGVTVNGGYQRASLAQYQKQNFSYMYSVYDSL